MFVNTKVVAYCGKNRQVKLPEKGIESKNIRRKRNKKTGKQSVPSRTRSRMRTQMTLPRTRDPATLREGPGSTGNLQPFSTR